MKRKFRQLLILISVVTIWFIGLFFMTLPSMQISTSVDKELIMLVNFNQMNAATLVDSENHKNIERLRLQDAVRKSIEDKKISDLLNGINYELQHKDTEFSKSVKNMSESDLVVLIKRGLVVPRWDSSVGEVPIDKNMPGEYGVGYSVNKDLLSKEEKIKYDKGWDDNAFNQYSSDAISLHRSLNDIRNPECKNVKYEPNMPDTSVIIIFHNEAWSALLRTVHSVIDRSPPHLLKEVILVDDYSDKEHLKKKLEDYITPLQKVKLVRSKKRTGLIRARLLGASTATGDILTFLDSHCECTPGWLEPLISRIAANWSNVVTPIIDVLDEKTLAYHGYSGQSTSVGGFDWNLQFNWQPIPQREIQRRKSPIDPVRSPTMAGGLFSISRKYFEYLGTYDPGMDIWGGENLELSFRVWMCGGTLEINMCSHVGHIFRERSPYKWRKGTDVLKKNSVRLAEVWMDQFKHIYFDRLGNILGDYGDVSSRKALRVKLQCKSFEWYLRNIYPELFIPTDALASGEIRCESYGKYSGSLHTICLDSPASDKTNGQKITLYPCHNQGGNQFWMLDQSGHIRRDEFCLDIHSLNSIVVQTCSNSKTQLFEYDKQDRLINISLKKCISLSSDLSEVVAADCLLKDSKQIWKWKRKVLQQNQSIIPSHFS